MRCKQILICGLLFTSVQAIAQHTVRPWRLDNCPGAQCSVYYKGQIRSEDVDALLAEIQTLKIETFIVSSIGGSSLPAIKLAHRIADLNADVVVEDICMSSCANYIFTSGHRKSIRDGAIIIWHGGAKSIAMKKAIVRAEQRERTAMEAGDTAAALGWREGISAAHRLEIEEAKLFARLGVDERVTRLGELVGNKTSQNWTIAGVDFQKFGISDVQFNPDYGSADYLKKLKSHVPIKVDTLSFSKLTGEAAPASLNAIDKPFQ